MLFGTIEKNFSNFSENRNDVGRLANSDLSC